jgi:hypothetical protein
MKVKQWKEVYQEFELTDKAALEVTIEKLEQLVSPGEYLREVKEGKKTKWVLKQDDPHHYHGSISEHFVRDATDLDIAVFKVLRVLKDKKNDTSRL